MLHLAGEGHHAERPAAALVVAGEILLVDQPAVALDQDRVHVEVRGGANVPRHRLEPMPIETGLLGRAGGPAIAEGRRRFVGNGRSPAAGRAQRGGQHPDEGERAGGNRRHAANHARLGFMARR
jgi:hypothetical protein